MRGFTAVGSFLDEIDRLLGGSLNVCPNGHLIANCPSCGSDLRHDISSSIRMEIQKRVAGIRSLVKATYDVWGARREVCEKANLDFERLFPKGPEYDCGRRRAPAMIALFNELWREHNGDLDAVAHELREGDADSFLGMWVGPRHSRRVGCKTIAQLDAARKEVPQ